MPSPRRTPGSVSRRLLAINILIIVVVLSGVAVVLDRLADAGQGAGAAAPTPSPSPPRPERPPVAAALPSPPAESPAASALGEAPPVLALPGEFPADGPGTFRFASGEGEVIGESGPVHRFRIAVEDGADEDPGEVAEFVEDTLGHRQSWTAGGDRRFQRVPAGAGHDFTIYLVTTNTAARLCAAVGLDVVGSGLPEGGVSCRTPGQVVLNLARWRQSVPHYVDAEVPLAVYRQMLVNHEVGHQLGYGHETCPGDGEPAPVMQQQSIELDGCEPNPWPYLDGDRYSGPRVP
jgi:Protein of unknown function (DUF3152)